MGSGYRRSTRVKNPTLLGELQGNGLGRGKKKENETHHGLQSRVLDMGRLGHPHITYTSTVSNSLGKSNASFYKKTGSQHVVVRTGRRVLVRVRFVICDGRISTKMLRVVGFDVWGRQEKEPQSVSKDVVSTWIGKLGLSLEEDLIRLMGVEFK